MKQEKVLFLEFEKGFFVRVKGKVWVKDVFEDLSLDLKFVNK